MSRPADLGSAAVDFVLVGSLVTLMFLAVVQVAIDYHIHDVLASCVADGARHAADADVSDPNAGADEANALITASIGARFATARPVTTAESPGEPPLVAVRARVRLPLLAWFLPWGPTVTVTGHAVSAH